MKLLFSAVVLAAFVTVNGLVCWHCFNKVNQAACLRTGVAKRCQSNALYCFSEIRRGSDGPRLFKRCKQPHACFNNLAQNPRSGAPTQCNPKSPTSVCRCCCNHDLCNRETELCVDPVGDMPECEKISAPRNGRKQCAPVEEDFKNTVVAGTVCGFKCNFGYTLIGDEGSVCELSSDGSTAEFNNPVPRCAPRFCYPIRRHPENGFVDCSDRNNIDSLCSYRCEPGYRLSGESTSRCLPTRKWSNPPPTCVSLTCNPPHENPENGRVDCSDGNNLKSFCRFTCDDTYSLVGRPSSTCIDDGDGDDQGVWNNPAPTCRKIECRPPHRNPRNGEVECSNGNLEGSVCSFNCLPGYSLEGTLRSTCEDDFDGDNLGLWSSPPPLCRRITCKPPHSNPTNGEVNCSDDNLEGSLCIFTCDVGHFLDGSPNSLCEDDGNLDDNGNWSQPAPVCIRITCRPPHRNPRNGDVSCSDSNNEGSLCSFTCRAGYYLNGSPRSRCVDDGDNDALGMWNEPAPTCSKVTCVPRQRNPTNGDVECTDANNAGSICSFACESGFFLDGSQTTVCNDDLDGDELGEWSDPAPVCRQVFCSPSFDNPLNGRVQCSNQNNIIGTSCRFSCDNGFFRRGAQTSRCVDDNDNDAQGVWNRPAPVCVQITCPPPHVAPDNGGVRCSNSNNEGSICRFTCDVGYFLDGFQRSDCNDDDNGDAQGVWSRPAPTCVPIRCTPGFTDPENGGVRCDDPLNNLGTVCRFSCDDGYFLNGPPTSTCQDDDGNDNVGVWSSQAPTCTRITCPPPHTDPRNGGVSCTDSNNENSECSFTCNAGFFLNGSPSSVCNDDGNGDAEGLWSEPAPTCVPIRCLPSLDAPDNGGVSCDNRRNILGTICSFTCNDGYFVNGSPTSECLDDLNNDADGVWSHDSPTCQRIVCPPPHVDPRNGAVNCSDGNNEGSICRFTCDDGYYLAGFQRSVCNDDDDDDAQGVWSRPAPTCVPIRCTPGFTDPENGRVRCDDPLNNLGTVCGFSCDDGYFLNGPPTSTCQDDDGNDNLGVWSSQAPTCTRITCPPPHTDPRNGGVSCTDSNNENSECSFTCNAGFFLNGSPSSVCNDDDNGDAEGLWSEPAPTCVPIRCLPSLDAPDNGGVSCDNLRNILGTICSFTCNDGYFVNGPPTSECLDDLNNDADGVWSHNSPTCQRIVCPPPHVDPRNGAVNCSDGNNEGSICRFTCDDGYFLNGFQRSVCNDDDDDDAQGVWSRPAPTCVPIRCTPGFTDPENGGVRCDDPLNNLGTTCSFTCDNGYFLSGSATSVCIDDDNGDAEGVWSEDAPPCIRITCVPPHVDPDNGNVSCSDFNNEGSRCNFVCDVEFYLDGSETSFCEDDGDDDRFGEWDENPPVCRPITCVPRLDTPRNGGISCDNSRNNLGTVCSFTCDDGYFLRGSLSSTCENDFNGDAVGVWSSVTPSCSRVTCPPPHVDPADGSVRCTDGNNEGSTCSFECNRGFFLDGFLESTCEDDLDGNNEGLWSRPAPTCVPIRCSPALDAPQNGTVRCNDSMNNLETTCNFRCDNGFFLSGSPRSECIDDLDNDAQGVWSEDVPTCIRIVCPPAHVNPNNGEVTCSDGNNLNSLCRFTCDDGYYLDGFQRSVCNDDDDEDAQGVWSRPAPTCVPIRCAPRLTDPENGGVRCDDPLNNLGTVCRFTCNDGYFVNGPPTSECLDDLDNDADGVWSHDSPTCQRIVCPPPHVDPRNGAVNCSDGNNEGSICRFTCDDGYFLDGFQRSVCNDDDDEDAQGVWSRPAPTCVPIRCTPGFTDPENGGVRCDNPLNNLGTTCRFRCDVRFFLVGSLTSECVEDNDEDAEGVWNQDAPICILITCLPPHVNPDNGRVECSDSNNVNSNCEFTCNENYALVGERQSLCVDDRNGDQFGEWSNEAPRCQLIVCLPPFTSIDNGDVECTNDNIINSDCQFTCNAGYELEGEPSSTCVSRDGGGVLGEWTVFPAPVCTRRGCGPAPDAPENGFRVCTDGTFLGSECEYGCNDYHTRQGSLYSVCVETADGLEWDRPAPVCEPNRCPEQILPRGEVTCDDPTLTAPATCTFNCTEQGYVLYPAEITENFCLNDTTWSVPRPCCARNCPPHARMDLNIILDSSSSIGLPNWETMVAFVETLIRSFTVSDVATRIALFRFNDDVYNPVQLNAFPTNQEDLVDALRGMNYQGNGMSFSVLPKTKPSVLPNVAPGPHHSTTKPTVEDGFTLTNMTSADLRTFTGRALTYSRETIFTSDNGDRSNAPNIILLITDGRAQDMVVRPARRLRNDGVTIYVVGVFPPQGRFDYNQLREIAGNTENIFLASSGFESLDEVFANSISKSLCPSPCEDDPRPI